MSTSKRRRDKIKQSWMLKRNLCNDMIFPVSPVDNETSVGRLIQYKATQVVVVKLAFLRFSTFGMLLKHTRFPWNVGWVSGVWGEWRWTLRGRGGEKRREKVENGSTCFSDSKDFATGSCENSCVCNCHKSWARYATHCRYIACCLYLAKMKKMIKSDETEKRCDEGDEQKRMKWQCWAYLWARLVSVCCFQHHKRGEIGASHQTRDP